jgi:hypothetical protein
LLGFSSLTKSDAIQQKIADLPHALSLLIAMCEEYPIVFDILWALSFNQDIQQQLRSNTSFMSKLSYLAKEYDNEQMRKITHGLLWNLEINHEDRSTLEYSGETSFDTMISYSHKDKEFCKQIYDELSKTGYRVWIDFDQMHGNMMDAMAQAIERSRTVIICMSEQYRKSNYCRAEAYYAFQRQRKIVPVLLQKHYKPDGWLLFLMGQLLYVDFTKHEFERAMGILFKELKAEEVHETNLLSHTPSISSPRLPNNIFEWTSTHVQDWLAKQNLTQMSRLLTNCNGRSLVYLNDFITNGQPQQILSLLQEDSLRRIGETLSLIELSCFRSLMAEQKQLLQSSIQS